MERDRINVLNKQGILTDEDRKQEFVHGCNHVTFHTNLDLSVPIKVVPYGTSGKIKIDHYSQDLASFICYWEHFIKKDLNGFTGFSHVKFELDGLEIV